MGSEMCIRDRHHNSRNSCPENFKWQVSFDGKAVAELAAASPKANQAEHEKANDSDKQNAADREQNLKQLVVNRRVGARIDGEEVDVLADPKAAQSKDHPDHQRENGGWDLHLINPRFSTAYGLGCGSP